MDRWLDKVGAFADHKKVSPEVILETRLAVDQFPVIGPILSACDQADFSVAKLTGKAPLTKPDAERTLAEIRARVLAMIAYMGTYEPEDFVGCAERPCVARGWVAGPSGPGTISIPSRSRTSTFT